MLRSLAFATLLVAITASGAGAQSTGSPAGRGTATLEVTAVRVEVAGVGSVGAVVTNGRATLDHERAGEDDDGAIADVAAVRAELPAGTSLTFPDPPVESRASRGRHAESKGDASVAVPPAPSEPGADSPVAPGSLASGNFLPAKVESWRDDAGAGALATSQLADLDLFSGLSRLAGAGPGEHRSWSQPDEVGATARALGVRSATIFELGPTLERLGVDLDSLSPGALLGLAQALGLDSAAAGLGLTVPAPPVLPAPVHDQLVDFLGDAPLLALTDVSGSVEAVAAVGPDGRARTAAEAAGSVGSVTVGGIELGGFDASASAGDWNAKEAEIVAAMNQVLGSVVPGARDLVRVRVMPVLRQVPRFNGAYAVATAEIRLLEVSISAPPPPPPPDPQAPPSVPGADVVDDVLDEVGQELPVGGGGGGGLPGVPGLSPLGSLEPGEVMRAEVGNLEATAEHTRPGVTPQCSACSPDGSPLNQPWTPTEGFNATADAPGSNLQTGTGTSSTLPKTGAGLGTVEAGAGLAFGGAAFVHRIAKRRVGASTCTTRQRGRT